MYDKNMGFICEADIYWSYFRKTTNGGLNWFSINDSNFNDIEFADTLIGYKVFTENQLKKTTDGGITWISQTRPSFFLNWALDLSVVNKDTVWYVGPRYYFSGYGIIMKTTNGGLNWGYQIPFTKIFYYKFIDFADKNNGWAYYPQNIGIIHTTTGGSDTTIYVGINNNVSITPTGYELEQNYPNPFNSMTNVKFKMLNSGFVEIKVFDITGKEIKLLTSGRYETGIHTIRFEAGDLQSGIYFYSLLVDGKVIDTKKAILIK